MTRRDPIRVTLDPTAQNARAAERAAFIAARDQAERDLWARARAARAARQNLDKTWRELS